MDTQATLSHEAGRPSDWLANVDKTHPFTVDKYLRTVSTIDDLRHNCSWMGISHHQYVCLAERARLPHEYDEELARVRTQEEGYLLLRKLHERGLVRTDVFAHLVVRLVSFSKNEDDLRELFHAISWSEKHAEFVAFFLKLNHLRAGSL